jgi:hypothetical protein
MATSALIFDLACSRVDCIPVGKRNALIGDVAKSLEASALDRSVLADLQGKY